MSDDASRIPEADSPCWLFDYKLGWLPIKDPLTWPEGGGDWEGIMRDNGYHTFGYRTLGREYDCVVKVREADDKAETPAPYQYVAEVGDDGPYLVFVNNLPSLVELFAKLAPLASAAILTSVAEDCAARIDEEADRTERKEAQERARRKAALARPAGGAEGSK